MITLIVGGTGAGKTTYARELAKEKSAVVYSIDNWMKSLYWQDMPDFPDMKWFQENHKWYTDRIARCEELIKNICLERAKFHQASLLDLGFTSAKHRKHFINFFQSDGIAVESHYLKIDPMIRWERVEQRNNNKGETHVMQVDRSMFDFMEGIFEEPSLEEGAPLILIDQGVAQP